MRCGFGLHFTLNRLDYRANGPLKFGWRPLIGEGLAVLRSCKPPGGSNGRAEASRHTMLWLEPIHLGCGAFVAGSLFFHAHRSQCWQAVGRALACLVPAPTARRAINWIIQHRPFCTKRRV